MFKKRIGLLVVGVLLALLAWSAASAAPPVEGEAGPGGPLLRLAYATFDPAQGEPAMPAQLHRAAYPNDEAGPYIIQFWGPIEPAWRAAIVEQGAQVESYLPDYALLVRLEGDAPAQLKRLPFVRWVGLFQPAYKMNPGLAPSRTGLYRLRLARRAGTAQVRRALAPLVGGVSGGGTSLVVQASFEQLPHIARLPDVLWIEEFRLFEPLNDKAAGVMNLSTPWNAGYTGAGQTVTIADTGLDTGVDTAAADDIHRDFDNRVTHISSWPVAPEPGCIANAGDNDGPSDVDTGHGTHVAGSVAGNGARSGGAFKGPAYQASITFQAVEQYTTWTGSCAAQYSSGYYLTGLPADLTTFFQEAYNWGSRIHTNSWGSSVAGAYTTSAQQVDQFAWDNKDLTILFAAGNSGEDADSNGYVDEDSIGSPGTAKNAITVGATDNNRPASGASSTWGAAFGFPAPPTSSDALSDDPGELAAFSSRGPTDDGRIKPDVVAPGTNILSTRSSLISGNGWFAYNNYYMFNGGTSMATPLTAGAAAVVRDYLVDGEGLPTPGAALIKALLINTAVDIGGYGNSNQEAGQPIPNNHEGWGRVDVAAATDSANRHLVDGRLLANGNTHTFNFTVTNTAVPLKVTLAWTDYPGDPAAGAQLVNDLNLKVTSPGASVYRGNHFSGGWSATGGAADSANNVENVFVQSPAAGVWSIEVSGSSVSQGPQPYALVIGGAGNLGDPLAASDTPPTLTVPPNQSAPEGVGSNNAVDLWSYATDSEEDFNALAFSISNSPAAQAGVTLDNNRYISINPTVGWTGTTTVQVQVADSSGLTDTTSFDVTVTQGSFVYLPIILDFEPVAPSGPTPGFWAGSGEEFYVTPNGSKVDDFAVYVSVSGCGNYKITHLPQEPITNDQFSFSGTFYASGTFNSATTASGTEGLAQFNIPGCGPVSGGPWSWSATWQNSSQPKFLRAEVVGLETVESTAETGRPAVVVTPVK